MPDPTRSEPGAVPEVAGLLEFGPARFVPGAGKRGFGRLEGYPLTADVSSPFGPRDPITLPDGRVTGGFHTGVDLPAPAGSPIFAPAPGEVVEQRTSLLFGNKVVLRHDDGSATAYLHMRAGALMVGEGTRLRRGSIIGVVGTTGFSTGNHLHWEYMPHFGITGVADPLPLLREHPADGASVPASPAGFAAETHALSQFVRHLRRHPIDYDAALGAIEREVGEMLEAIRAASG